MTTAVQPAAPDTTARREPWLHLLQPGYRVALRWLYIGVLTLIAFRHSLASLVEVTRGGGMGGYVWIVPLAAVLAGTSVARRPRTELPIHDRQTDIIVGTLGLVLALLVHAVLMQRYALYFHLLRLDFLAMWLFVVGAAVVLFGLRPVTRFFWVWMLLLMVFPLPYHLTVFLLGGNRMAGGAATLIVGAFATAIAVGRSVRRAVIGSILAWAVGLGVLAVMALYLPDAPLLAYQQIPALTAILLVGILLYLHARRGKEKNFLDRKIEPLAAGQVWVGLPLVAVFAILLSLVKLPTPPTPPTTQISEMNFAAPLPAPAGWKITDEQTFPWVHRLYGRDAEVTRQRMIALSGNPKWDKHSDPRTVVVDSVVTGRPMSFVVYPTTLLYDLSATRLSAPRRVDLGHGVTGQLVSVVDDKLVVTWNALAWTWRNARQAQRIVVLSVDNHEDDAPFPIPAGGIPGTLNSMFTILFRGNAAVGDRNPVFKDAEMLTEFSRALVAARMRGFGP